jgi:hypothetical protein
VKQNGAKIRLNIWKKMLRKKSNINKIKKEVKQNASREGCSYLAVSLCHDDVVRPAKHRGSAWQ